MSVWERFRGVNHRPGLGAIEILRYIGPGLLVTVGFIDPGNWAANIEAGSHFGYSLLWVVALSTVFLVILQHNVAHIGIVTGLCLSEAARRHLRPAVSVPVLLSAVLATLATALAEVLGGAIALQMLFGLPIPLGAILVAAVVLWLLLTNSYRKVERWIIGLVSVIGLSFLYETMLAEVSWGEVARGLVVPSLPVPAIPAAMAMLGAVVMPHNLYLHSEVIQSRQWNVEQEEVIQRQLRYEFLDTLLAMGIGFAVNSAMVILAAATFHASGQPVEDLAVAARMLDPLLGSAAAVVFSVALLLAGVAAAVTAGMAGGSIVAGMFGEPYDMHDPHTRWGVLAVLIGGAAVAFFVRDTYQALLASQMVLAMQLPLTILTQVRLTSSREVMGRHANSALLRATVWAVAAFVIGLNVLLVWQMVR